MSELTAETTDDAEEMLALGRMVSFACQRAQSMKLEFSTYCLELALTSLMQDMVKAGVSLSTNVPQVGISGQKGLH